MESRPGCTIRDEWGKKSAANSCRNSPHFYSAKLRLEQPSNTEEELAMAGVAIGISRLDGPEDSVDDDTRGTVSGEARGLVDHAVGRPVNLRGLVHPQEID